jgi:hypothetical protein
MTEPTGSMTWPSIAILVRHVVNVDHLDIL